MIYKQKLKWLFAGTGFILIILGALYLNFELLKKKHFYNNGGFKRNVISIDFKLIKESDLPSGNYEIINSDRRIFLHNFEKNTAYSVEKSNLKKINKFNFTSLTGRNVLIYNLIVDSSTNRLFAYDNRSLELYGYDLKSNKFFGKCNLNTRIDKIFQIKNDIIIVQKSESRFKFGFFKGFLDFKSGVINLSKNNDLSLSNMVDDGKLVNNSTCFIYTCFYRNKYYCFNENLSIKYSANLIDTISQGPTVKFISRRGKDSGRLEYTSPIRITNANSVIKHNNLFIESMVGSNSDNYKLFTKSLVLDKYDIKEKKYIGTYFIPKIDDQRIDDFFIEGRDIYIISSNKILVYESKVDI